MSIRSKLLKVGLAALACGTACDGESVVLANVQESARAGASGATGGAAGQAGATAGAAGVLTGTGGQTASAGSGGAPAEPPCELDLFIAITLRNVDFDDCSVENFDPQQYRDALANLPPSLVPSGELPADARCDFPYYALTYLDGEIVRLCPGPCFQLRRLTDEAWEAYQRCSDAGVPSP